MQYDINREAAKISSLSSGKVINILEKQAKATEEAAETLAKAIEGRVKNKFYT